MPRDVNGGFTRQRTYSPGTRARADDVNTNESDIGAEIADSLSRSGKGGMLAPLKLADGSQTEPALTFGSAPNRGLLKTATGFAMTIGGTIVQEWVPGRKWWNSDNDGDGSGLDADTVDGKQAAEISSEAVATVRGGVAAAYDTLKEIYDWAAGQFGTLATAVAGKVSKAGDTLTGAYRIEGNGATVPILQFRNTKTSTGKNYEFASRDDGYFALYDVLQNRDVLAIDPDGYLLLPGIGRLTERLASKAPLKDPMFEGVPKAEAFAADRDGYPAYEFRDRNATGLRRHWACYVDSPTGSLVFLDRGTDGQGTAQPWMAIYPDGRVRMKQLSQAGNTEGDLVNWVAAQIAAATAPKNVGEIGSYALCRTLVIRAPGSSYAGSELEYAGFYFENPSAANSLRGASAWRRGTNAAPQPLTGTWRIMSFIGENGSPDQTSLGLFQRIA